MTLATLLSVISRANRIHFSANSRFSKAIRDEARNFELKITDAGNLTFGAEGSKHDDLIIALTHILWFGERRGGGNRPRVLWI